MHFHSITGALQPLLTEPAQVPGEVTQYMVSATHYFAHFLAFLDRNIGLRHLFLLSVLVVYSLIGGYVFYYFETNGEAEVEDCTRYNELFLVQVEFIRALLYTSH